MKILLLSLLSLSTLSIPPIPPYSPIKVMQIACLLFRKRRGGEIGGMEELRLLLTLFCAASGPAAFGQKNLPEGEPERQRRRGASSPYGRGKRQEARGIRGEPPVPPGPPPGQVSFPKAVTDAIGRKRSWKRKLPEKA